MGASRFRRLGMAIALGLAAGALADAPTTAELVAQLRGASDAEARLIVESLARRDGGSPLLDALEQADERTRSLAARALARIEPLPLDVARRLPPIYARNPEDHDLEDLMWKLEPSPGPALVAALVSLRTDGERIALLRQLHDFDDHGAEAVRLAVHDASPEVALAAMEELPREAARSGAFIPDVVDFLRVPATLEEVEERWFSPSGGGYRYAARCWPIEESLHDEACKVVSDAGGMAPTRLLEILRSDAPAARRASVFVAAFACLDRGEVPQIEQDALAEAALAAASDRLPALRVAAFAALSSHPVPDASSGVPALLAGLRDRDPRVRSCAGAAMGAVVAEDVPLDARQVEALIEALGDDDPLVAEGAGSLLAQADASVVPSLVRALASDDVLPATTPWEPRPEAGWHHDVGPRLLASRALVRHAPDPRVLEAERELLSNGPVATRRAMAEALDWSHVDDVGRRELISAVMRDPDPIVRASMLRSLRGDGHPCERLLALRFSAADDPSPVVRRHAARMLGEDRTCSPTDAQRVHATLLALAADEDPGVALVAADGLTRTERERSDEEWRAIVRARIRGARHEATSGGSPMLPPPAWPLMLEAAREDPGAWPAAARAMPESRDLLRLLVEGLAASDVTTQVLALEALDGIPVLDAATSATIEALARTSTTGAVRRAAARALGGGAFLRLADGWAAAALARLAQDAPVDARLEAALLLENADWQAAARALLAILGRGGLEEPDRSRAEASLGAIASRWIPCASPPGISRASVGCNPDLNRLLPEGPPRMRRRAASVLAGITECPP